MLALWDACCNGAGEAKSLAVVLPLVVVVVFAAPDLLFSRECLPDVLEESEDSNGFRSLSGCECVGALGVVSPPEVSRRELQNEPSMLACTGLKCQR